MNNKDYQELLKDLNKHAYNYYVLDKPTISDSQYTERYKKLQQYEQDNPLLVDPQSPTQRVGDKRLEAFEPFTHNSNKNSF